MGRKLDTHCIKQILKGKSEEAIKLIKDKKVNVNCYYPGYPDVSEKTALSDTDETETETGTENETESDYEEDPDCADSCYGETPLIAAAYRDDLRVAEALVQEGANINFFDKKGWSALHTATLKNSKQVLDFLILNGANAYIPKTPSRTPLALITQYHSTDIVIPLLMAGASLMLEDGESAVTWMKEHIKNEVLSVGATDKSFSNECAVVKVLAAADTLVSIADMAAANFSSGYSILKPRVLKSIQELGAGLNGRSLGGKTALHLAMFHGNRQLAALLLEKGANSDLRDKNGKRPFDYKNEVVNDLCNAFFHLNELQSLLKPTQTAEASLTTHNIKDTKEQADSKKISENSAAAPAASSGSAAVNSAANASGSGSLELYEDKLTQHLYQVRDYFEKHLDNRAMDEHQQELAKRFCTAIIDHMSQRKTAIFEALYGLIYQLLSSIPNTNAEYKLINSYIYEMLQRISAIQPEAQSDKYIKLILESISKSELESRFLGLCQVNPPDSRKQFEALKLYHLMKSHSQSETTDKTILGRFVASFLNRNVGAEGRLLGMGNDNANNAVLLLSELKEETEKSEKLKAEVSEKDKELKKKNEELQDLRKSLREMQEKTKAASDKATKDEAGVVLHIYNGKRKHGSDFYDSESSNSAAQADPMTMSTTAIASTSVQSTESATAATTANTNTVTQITPDTGKYEGVKKPKT